MTLARDILPRAVRWLWRNRVPCGMVSVMAGRPGGGKSLLVAHLAADISHHSAVILSCAEDPQRESVRPRLEAAGADLTRVHVRTLALPDDLQKLECEIERDHVALVVIDPIAAHLYGGITRYNDSIRGVTNRLHEIAEHTGCAFVLIDHVVKRVSKTAHPLSAIGGSGSGLAAAARMAFIVGLDPDDDERVLLCCAKTNVRDAPPALAFAVESRTFTDDDGFEGTAGVLSPPEECEFDPMRLLVSDSATTPGRPPHKRTQAIEWLSAYLLAADRHEARQSDLVEDAKLRGITEKTLDRASRALGVIKHQRDRAWWWRLPEPVTDAAAGEDEAQDDEA